MSEKKIKLAWSTSLIVIGLLTLFNSVTNIIGISLPTVVRIIFAIIEIPALAVMIYASVKILKEKR